MKSKLESLELEKFQALSDDETVMVLGGAGTGTYERQTTNGGTDSILVKTDEVDQF